MAIDKNKINVLSNSPLRKIVQKNDSNLFSAEIQTVKEIDSILKTVDENSKNPLKIVILGEVKAGKSTLINSIVGKKVSYVDVSEATSTIIEIKYSDSENITIFKEDGTSLSLPSLDALSQYVDKSRNELGILSNVRKIEVCTNTVRLREVTIVDTPGLNTITSENARRTDNYIANSDVILWVLNSNHLGQRDVSEKIEEVMDFGKPIICIANRIDETQGGSDSIKGYIEEEMGWMFKDIFTTSAKKAWEGILSSNNNLLQESNVIALYDYLVNNIERNAEQVQEDSIDKTIDVQLSRDYQAHMDAQIKAEKLINTIRNNTTELKRTNDDIMRMVDDKLEQWAEFDFFREEQMALSTCKDFNSFNNLIQQYGNNEYLNQLVITKNTEMSEYLYKEWGYHTVERLEKIAYAVTPSITAPNSSTAVQSVAQTADTGSIITEGMIQGGIKGAAAGVGLSLVAAIGPAATIGSAIMSICPPLLAIGAVGGIVAKFMQSHKQKQENREMIDAAVNQMRTKLKNELNSRILPSMRENLKNVSNTYFTTANTKILSILEEYSMSDSELNKMYDELKIYTSRFCEATGISVNTMPAGVPQEHPFASTNLLSSDSPPSLF